MLEYVLSLMLVSFLYKQLFILMIVWKDLTVAEHLTFQARQRGIPAHRLSAEVQKAALSVGLDGDGFYTKAGDLSGGMRRRLSIAMSVVGNPPIIFMDGDIPLPSISY